jgi:glycosyltransferase involved in cell wall biosynthesis
MSALPTISVVIPTYKAAPWLEETLGSVLHQTYPFENIEIIVIDDASPDDSVDVAKALLEGAKIKSRVVAREKNAGPAANRNAGWRMATGDWIQFLDQDDVLVPHKFKLQGELAARAGDDVAVVYSSWQSLELREGTWQPTGPVNAPRVDEDTVLRILQEVAFGYLGPTLIRRSALAGIDGFEERPNIGEDMNMMLRLSMAGGKFLEARSEGGAAFLYRQTPGSLWKVYIKNVVAMRNLLHTFRLAEEFLRTQQSGGRLTDEARFALGLRYGRFGDFYLEHDPESFRELEAWLHGLGFAYPPTLGRGMKAAAKVLGYRNALRARAKYRQLRGRD